MGIMCLWMVLYSPNKDCVEDYSNKALFRPAFEAIAFDTEELSSEKEYLLGKIAADHLSHGI